MLVPASMFGIILNFHSSNHPTTLPNILSSTLATIAYVWVHLLFFCISNQRRPVSIEEDRVNKPWRPLPSKRLSVEAAEILLRVMQCSALLLAWSLGSLGPSMGAMVLTYMYNDLGLGDTSFFARNLINGLGYMAFNLGAATVACQGVSMDDFTWTAILGLVVLCSIHSLDLSDQVGDAVNNRNTLPLILGDGLCRVTIAAAVLVSSIACPAFCQVNEWGYGMCGVMAAVVCGYLWSERGSEGKKAGRSYMLWLLALYFLPLFPRL